MSHQCLVVWDFDHSLVDENSDTWVIEKLCPSLIKEFKTLQGRDIGWTDIMNIQMETLWELGFREHDIKQSLATVPLQPRMVELVNFIHQHGATQVILSDANAYFIDVITQHNGIRPMFSSIHTNSASFSETNQLLIQPHQPKSIPHGCSLCPPNLCKGSVLDTIKKDYSKVIYVGDGQGDFCPAIRLQNIDIVLARHSESKPFKLWEMLQNPKIHDVKARVYPWETGGDLYQLFSSFMN